MKGNVLNQIHCCCSDTFTDLISELDNLVVPQQEFLKVKDERANEKNKSNNCLHVLPGQRIRAE